MDLTKEEKNGLNATMIKFPQPNQLFRNQLGSSNSTWIYKINSRKEQNDFLTQILQDKYL
jgi:hypothetical protein